MGSGGGKRTKKKSGMGRMTKGESVKGKITGILVIIRILVVIGVLVYLLTSFWASFCFDYLFLILLVPLQLLIFFSKIFFFIFIILVSSNNLPDFGTIISVQTDRSWTESFIYIKFGIKGTIF